MKRIKIEKRLLGHTQIHSFKQCLGIDIKHSVEHKGVVYMNVDKFGGGDEDIVNLDKETFNIYTKLCLDSGAAIRSKKRFTSQEALSYFCEKTGLALKNKPKCHLLVGCAAVKNSYSINNGFEIGGEFTVFDRDLFKKTIEEGIGSRGSYGFGYLVVL